MAATQIPCFVEGTVSLGLVRGITHSGKRPCDSACFMSSCQVLFGICLFGPMALWSAEKPLFPPQHVQVWIGIQSLFDPSESSDDPFGSELVRSGDPAHLRTVLNGARGVRHRWWRYSFEMHAPLSAEDQSLLESSRGEDNRGMLPMPTGMAFYIFCIIKTQCVNIIFASCGHGFAAIRISRGMKWFT